MGQGIGGGQVVELIAVRAVHLAFPPAEQPGAGKGEHKVDHHGDGEGFKIGIQSSSHPLGGEEKLHGTDNAQHAGILDVDNQVVADLRHDVPEGLGQDDAGHGLHMVHANGLGAVGLSRVD